MTIVANPTLEATLRTDAKRPLSKAKRRATPGKRKRVGRTPRKPDSLIAQAEAQLLEITGDVNVALLRALRPILTGEGELTPADLQRAIQRVRFSVPTTSDAQAQELAIQNLGHIDRFNRRDVQRTIGVSVPEFSGRIGEQWRQEHVGLIKSLGETPKTRIAEMLRDASRKGTRVETLKKQLENELGVNERRARLIARDQILTLNSKLTEDRHKKAGITEYIWRTVGDASARSHHKDLDGRRFKYTEPPMGGGTGPDDRGHPGSGIGCRCQQIPIVPEFE